MNTCKALIIFFLYFFYSANVHIYAQDVAMGTDALSGNCILSSKDIKFELGGEFGFALNPIYGLQKSGPFYLNGKNIGPSGAAFYCSQPGKHILEHFFKDMFDEASSYYFPFSFRTKCFNKRKRFHMILGVTHDKMQVEGPLKASQDYRFNDGGEEWTILASYGWNIARNIEIIRGRHGMCKTRKNGKPKYTEDQLIMKLEFQGGYFLDVDKIEVNMYDSRGDHLYVVPNHRTIGDGHGFTAYFNEELGWRFWDRFAIISGFKLGGIYNHSVATLAVNNICSKLTNNTYGIFLNPFIKFGFILKKAHYNYQTFEAYNIELH